MAACPFLRTDSEVASPERQHLAIFSGVDRLAPMLAGQALCLRHSEAVG